MRLVHMLSPLRIFGGGAVSSLISLVHLLLSKYIYLVHLQNSHPSISVPFLWNTTFPLPRRKLAQKHLRIVN